MSTSTKATRETLKKCEICSKLTIRKPMTLYWCLCYQLWTNFTSFWCVFIVGFDKENPSPAGIYCVKLTMWNIFNFDKKTPEWRQWLCSGVFIVNFKYISHLDLAFLLLTLSRQISSMILYKGNYPQQWQKNLTTAHEEDLS